MATGSSDGDSSTETPARTAPGGGPPRMNRPGGSPSLGILGSGRSDDGDSRTGLLYRAYLEIPGSGSSITETPHTNRPGGSPPWRSPAPLIPAHHPQHVEASPRRGIQRGLVRHRPVVANAWPGTTIGIGDAFGAVLGNRVIPGRHVIVRLSLFTDGTGTNLDGTIVRTLAGRGRRADSVSGPGRPDEGQLPAALERPCHLPGSRPIWGAYRAESIGRIVGGALSLAAGGDGKPTLEPILPGLPPVQIVEGCREDLDMLPYAVAAGQTLGEWLRDLLGLLGVRVEMLCTTENKVAVILTDRPPIGQTVNMSLAGSTPRRTTLSRPRRRRTRPLTHGQITSRAARVTPPPPCEAGFWTRTRPLTHRQSTSRASRVTPPPPCEAGFWTMHLWEHSVASECWGRSGPYTPAPR